MSYKSKILVMVTDSYDPFDLYDLFDPLTLTAANLMVFTFTF